MAARDVPLVTAIGESTGETITVAPRTGGGFQARQFTVSGDDRLIGVRRQRKEPLVLARFRPPPQPMIPLFDNNQRSRAPVVTVLLIAANLATFVYQLLLFQQGNLDRFIRTFAFTPELFIGDAPANAQTIVTSMFLHGSWLHLLFNLWFLWLFGNMVESRLGSFRYLFLYLLAGIGAAAAQFAVAPFSPIPMLGASGAIAGILGAYLIFFPKAIIFTFVPIWFAPIIPVPAFVFLILWFFLQVWQGLGAMLSVGESGGVAWWAHFGGFVAGFFVSRKWKRRRRG